MSWKEKLIPVLTAQLKTLPGEQAHKVMSPPQRLQIPDYAKPRSDTRTGSVSLILCFTQSEIIIPFIRRNIYDGPHSGQIALPGGGAEAEDNSIIDTAIRETKEEIGVEIQNDQIIGKLSDLYIPVSNFLVTPVLAACSGMPSFKPDPSEVDEILLFNLADIADASNRKSETFSSVKGKNFIAPCFAIGERKIWGATAMILNEFLHLFQMADKEIGFLNQQKRDEK